MSLQKSPKRRNKCHMINVSQPKINAERLGQLKVVGEWNRGFASTGFEGVAYYQAGQPFGLYFGFYAYGLAHVICV